MRLLLSLLSLIGVLGDEYITPRTENPKQPTFSREFLETYPALDWNEFVANYEEIKRIMGWDVPNRNSWEMEDYRIYRRDRFNFMDRPMNPARMARMTAHYPENEIDQLQICPDTVSNSITWDEAGLDEATAGFLEIDGQTVILDRNVDLAGDGLRIINGGKLIFKDFARSAPDRQLGITQPLTLRAKSVEVTDHGELWIGSRSCRYLGKADIVLYGNEGDMAESDARPGSKYLWANTNGVLEMHGKEKLPWTQLDEHIFRNNIAAEQHFFKQNHWINCDPNNPNAKIDDCMIHHPILGNRLVFHILSAEGDLKSTEFAKSGDTQDMTNLISLINSLENEEIILFTTDFLFELTDQLKNFLVSYGFSDTDLTALMATEARRKYSQIGGVFNLKGQTDLVAVWPEDDGRMHKGLQGVVGPVDLGGEKTGFQFQVQFMNFYRRGDYA